MVDLPLLSSGGFDEWCTEGERDQCLVLEQDRCRFWYLLLLEPEWVARGERERDDCENSDKSDFSLRFMGFNIKL